MNKKISDTKIVSPVLFLCMAAACNIGWQFLVLPNILLTFLTVYKRKDISFGYGAVALACMLAAAIISIFTTLGDKQDAVHEIAMVFCFILAFLCGKATDEKHTLKSIAFLGFLIAAVGILAYCGIIRVSEFVFYDRGLVRLQSFIKYANTAALFLGCSYFTALDGIQKDDGIYLQYFGSCILLAMFLTVSKAEIPLFILIGTILCIFSKKHIRLFITQNSICAVFAVIIHILVRQGRNGIALMLALFCIFIAGRIHLRIIKNEPVLICVWILMLTTGIIGCVFSADLHGYNIFATLFKRLVYISDALKLLKDNWLTGIGAGAWRICQYKAQHTEYSVNYLHNGWLQIWLENGVIFFAAFVSLFISGLLSSIKHKQYTVSAILLLIMLHSLVDINLSFGIILIVSGLLTGNTIEDNKAFRPMPAACCGIALVSALLNLEFGYEYTLRNIFEKAYLNERYDEAYRCVQKLERICPYDSRLKVSIASLDPDNAKSKLEAAIRLSPYDKDIFKNYISYLVSNECSGADYPGLFDEYISLAPKQEKTYVDIKKLSKDGYEKNLYSLREYNEIISNAEKRRKEENVADRNELLNELTKEKGQ